MLSQTKWLCQFITPPTVYEISSCFISLPRLDIITFWNFSHCSRSVVVKCFELLLQHPYQIFICKQALVLWKALCFCCHWVFWYSLGHEWKLGGFLFSLLIALHFDVRSVSWNLFCMWSSLQWHSGPLPPPGLQVWKGCPPAVPGYLWTLTHPCALCLLPESGSLVLPWPFSFGFILKSGIPSRLGMESWVWRPLTPSLLVEGSEVCLFKPNRGCQR